MSNNITHQHFYRVNFFGDFLEKFRIFELKFFIVKKKEKNHTYVLNFANLVNRDKLKTDTQV